MENVIRQKVSGLIEKCIKLEKDAVCENGNIKEEYQATILDKYLEIFTEFDKGISVEELEIIVDEEKDIIKRFYIIYYVLDARMFEKLSEDIVNNPGWKSEARIRLYMMYLKSFREILFLLAGGFSDCALARTRTLYELGVYINIINKNTDALAERFCRYCNVQSLKISEAMLLEERTNEIENFIKQFNYEDGYKKENGWARILFPNIKDKSSVQFYDLVKLTEYKEHQNMYKMACNFVHGSLFSSLQSLDSAKEKRGKNFWNTSPSNEGIVEIIQFLKLYIVMFVNEYAKTFSGSVILEMMLQVFLVGKDAIKDNI